MKKLPAIIGGSLFLIFLALSVSAQDYKAIREGVEYAEMTREIEKTPVRMNLLRLDLRKSGSMSSTRSILQSVLKKLLRLPKDTAQSPPSTPVFFASTKAFTKATT